MDAPINVWNEVRITADGISITLLSESAGGGGAVVEDETWFTFDELTAQSPSAPISLYLSDETLSAFEEQRRLAQVGRIHDSQESDLPEVGDVVKDENPPEHGSAYLKELEVVEVLPDARADEYVIQGENATGVTPRTDQHWSDGTVADANPSYDEDEPVVIAQYKNSTAEYAFPASRLSEI